MQNAPLEVKVLLTQQRIREWIKRYGEDGVYISFSGGKDSTVLSHIVDDMYPNNHIPRVHVRTGLEYPEIEKFCEAFHDIVIIKPQMTFKQVIEKYGYPFISKEVCESAEGARRYVESFMKKVLDKDEDNAEAFTDRQTDRHPYRYYYEKLMGEGKYRKAKPSRQEIARNEKPGGGRQKVSEASWSWRI